MVFHGGFSRGCRTCLKRRVKCDEGKPTCQRCIKAKKECLGYRDDNDLAFKDETASTVRKVSNIGYGNINNSNVISSSSSSNTTTTTSSSSTITTSNQLAEDIRAAEANAVQHFITHFAEPAAKCNASQGFFPYTKRFYEDAAPDSAIMLTLVALALTLVPPSSSPSSTLDSESSPKRRALVRYGDALRKLGQALNDPVESRSDSTIMTILLLANLGEILDTPAPVPHGIVHSNAAAHILRARGREMSKDEESLQLLMRMRLILAYSHAIRALPVQDLVDDNDPEALSWSDLPTHIRTHPTHMLNSLALSVAGLRARVKTLLSLPADASSISIAANVVRECVEVEAALQCWLRDLPADWKEDIIDHRGIYVRISDTEELRPCPGVRGLSRYRDAWVSNQHYGARDFRAFLQAMIMRCGAWLSGMRVQDMSPAQLDENLALLGFPGLKPREALQDLVDALCRSIFYNLGATMPQLAPGGRSEDDASTPPNETIISSSLHDLRPAVGAPYITTRPLMIANSALIIPACQQQWIKSVLRILGNKLELSTALMIADTPLGYEHPLFGVHPSLGRPLSPATTAASTPTVATTTWTAINSPSSSSSLPTSSPPTVMN